MSSTPGPTQRRCARPEPETSDEISIGHMYEHGRSVPRDYATALPLVPTSCGKSRRRCRGRRAANRAAPGIWATNAPQSRLTSSLVAVSRRAFFGRVVRRKTRRHVSIKMPHRVIEQCRNSEQAVTRETQRHPWCSLMSLHQQIRLVANRVNRKLIGFRDLLQAFELCLVDLFAKIHPFAPLSTSSTHEEAPGARLEFLSRPQNCLRRRFPLSATQRSVGRYNSRFVLRDASRMRVAARATLWKGCSWRLRGDMRGPRNAYRCPCKRR
jgi:hypothetical protein